MMLLLKLKMHPYFKGQELGMMSEQINSTKQNAMFGNLFNKNINDEINDA